MVKGWREIWQRESLEGHTVWFHVSSLGEFEQARPVIDSFKKEYPNYHVWVTFFSPSGYEVRKNTTEADRVTYFPMDSKRNAQRLLQLINPSVAFFVKYDFWFNTLIELNAQRVPTFIFSAIFRKNHYFFKPSCGWFLKQLNCFTHIFVQNSESLQLLRRHGIERCTQTGDTRLDRVRQIAFTAEGVPEVERFIQSTTNNAKCLIAGSSWEPDEQNIRVYLDLCSTNLKLILAPHVISESHITKIEELFGKECCVRYSQIIKDSGNSFKLEKHNVLIIDNIGLLSRLYRYADVAYIGGGFGRGIHNILEAVTYGKPVVFGPNHQKFQEALDIIALGGGFAYDKSRELKTILDRLLTDSTAYNEASIVCQKYMETNIGSTDAIIQTIKKHIKP